MKDETNFLNSISSKKENFLFSKERTFQEISNEKFDKNRILKSKNKLEKTNKKRFEYTFNNNFLIKESNFISLILSFSEKEQNFQVK
jgi:hypothetical protein